MLPFRSKKYQEKMAEILRSEDVLEAGKQILGIDLVPYREQAEDFWSKWERLPASSRNAEAQRVWGGRLEQLLLLYEESDRLKQSMILEVLGYLKEERAANFLIKELSQGDESLSLACAAALKKQDPLLILEPMVEAMHQPQSISAARIYDVLQEIGPLLVPLILQKLPAATQQSKLVMLQLLGAFGDETVADVLAEYAFCEEYSLKKAATEALCRLRFDATAPMMKGLLKDKHWQIRLLAAETLAKDARGLPYLEEALPLECDKIVKEVLEQAIAQGRRGEYEREPQVWERIG